MILKCPECGNDWDFSKNGFCGNCARYIGRSRLNGILIRKNCSRTLRRLGLVQIGGAVVRQTTRGGFLCAVCGQKRRTVDAHRRGLVEAAIGKKLFMVVPCGPDCSQIAADGASLLKTIRQRAGLNSIASKRAASVALNWKQQMAQLEAFASSVLQELENDKGV